MDKIIKLPKIICGEIITDADEGVHEIEYAHGVKVHIPKLTAEDLNKIFENRVRLHDISLGEITQFLRMSGTQMSNPEYSLRKEAAKYGSLVTGLSPEMIHRDFRTMSSYLKHRNVIYDLLDAELGTYRVVDEWVNNQVARIRAFPRGRALHILVGNVPIAGLYSILRSIITKNQTVVKLATRDIISSLYFALSLIKENTPMHPISRSISVFYCDRNSSHLKKLIHTSDIVCAWGQGSSIEALKKDVPYGVPFLEFGPKRSLSLVYLEDDSVLDKVAMRIANDFSVYDQEACFSPQHLFVIGDSKKLIPKICKWLDIQTRILPKGKMTSDIESHVYRAKLEAKYRGWDVYEGKNQEWQLIDANNPYLVTNHPLSRTIYVHVIQSPREILPFVDDDTQTIGLYPLDKYAIEIANLFCSKGACRVCEIGLTSHFRQGFTHDGSYPLQQFVRMAYIDGGLEQVYKYGDYSLDDYEKMLFGAGLIGE